MENWPEPFHHNPVEFRAPPPSPIASGRRSSVANDEFLTEFLHHSLRVPDLVLPDRLSPRQKSKIQNLPKLDYKLLNSIENFDEIARTGCFELVNHGLSDQLIRSVSNYVAEIFDLSPEKKAVMSRSGDMMYGFVDFHGEETEAGEEFVWCRDDALRSKMEAVLPLQISNYSQNLEILTSEIEKICGIIQNFLTNSLRYDMIRMLIRGSEHSHTLSVHVSNGSEFHVYSKRGLVSFCPGKDALVITIGDRLQRRSEGKYKHVMGRPIFKGGEGDYCVSMAFMYNPPPPSLHMNDKTLITLANQVLFLFILALFYKFYCN